MYMKKEDKIDIGGLYDAYLMDMEAAGFRGEDCEIVAAQMARLWYGLLLSRFAGCPFPADYDIEHTERLRSHIEGWLADLEDRIDEIVI
jgi:hypothetical protein